MRVIFRLISIGCLLTVSSCASGGKNWWRDGSPEGPAGVGYGLEIVVDGVALPVYEHNGKSFVEGRMGERFTLRLHNHREAPWQAFNERVERFMAGYDAPGSGR